MDHEDGFMQLLQPIVEPQNTSVEGVFSAGMVNGPKDIVDSILDASSSAMYIDNYLRINFKINGKEDNKTVILETVH